MSIIFSAGTYIIAQHRRQTLCNLTMIVQSAFLYQALKFEFNVSQSENLHLCCHRVAIFGSSLWVLCYCSAWLKS